MKKRFLNMLLCLCMVLCIMHTEAFAGDCAHGAYDSNGNFIPWAVEGSLAPDQSAAGYHTYTCSKCGVARCGSNCVYTRTYCTDTTTCTLCGRAIEAGYHKFMNYGSKKTWNRTEDGVVTCTAVRKCYYCPAYEDTAHTATVTVISTTAATCEKAGETKYEANFYDANGNSISGLRSSTNVYYTSAKLGHEPGEYKSDNNATCYKDGTKTACCVRYGTGGCTYKDTITDTGSKREHDLHFEYVWNYKHADYSDCVVVMTCEYNDCGFGTAILSEDITAETVSEAGCLTAGKVKYTAKFENYISKMDNIAVPDAVEYVTTQEALGHSKATNYTSDASGHWYTCTNPGCTEKLDFANHTPDHEGHATEEYAIRCTECKYVIEARKSSGGGGGGVSTYNVTVNDSENGTVTADRKTAFAGNTVTLTVTPDKGWTLETLTATDQNGKEIDLDIVEIGEKYTFKMPSGKVTVTATFMEDNTMLNYFVDVNAQDYFYDAVLWAVEKGVTDGTDALHFSPNNTCTRAQIVTFLWRAAGSSEPKSASSFSDVDASSYYAKAVAWAVEQGITGGTGNGEFSPNATCTRAQAVTFRYRASGSPAVSGSSRFDDVADSAYYADAVKWAETEGITDGTGSNTFSPNSTCTRAQIVTFIWRALGK